MIWNGLSEDYANPLIEFTVDFPSILPPLSVLGKVTLEGN